jgi:hypothetical protein
LGPRCAMPRYKGEKIHQKTLLFCAICDI